MSSSKNQINEDPTDWELLNFVSKLTPEQEALYDKIWAQKMHSLNGRTLTPDDQYTIKKGIGLSVLAFAGAVVGFRGVYKYSKTFNHFVNSWKKLTFVTWVSLMMVCWSPALVLPMKIPYQTFIDEYYRRPTASAPEEQRLVPRKQESDPV